MTREQPTGGLQPQTTGELALSSPSRALSKHERALDYCTYCPKLCRHSCPVGGATGRETHSPQAKMQLLGALRANHLPWGSEYVEPLFACTGCRRCKTYCDHDNNVADALFAGRAVALARGVTHPALGTLVADWRADAEQQLANLRAALGANALATTGELGYLPSTHCVEGDCDAVKRALAVFRAAGHEPHVVDATCFDAGEPLWAAGMTDSARHAGEDLLRRVRGFSAVVCDSARVVEILRHRLPDEGIEHGVRVLHVSELLAENVERLPVVRRRTRVFYHDDCALGRGLGVYEPPRRVLAACADEVSELFHSGENADCCGNRGLVPLTFPEVPERASRPILDEVALYGGHVLVSGSPRCCSSLAAVAQGIEVINLIQLVAWALDQ